MKTLKLLLTAVACCALFASLSLAQGGAATGPAPVKAVTAEKKVKSKIFACEKCHMASTHGGKCPGCGSKMSAINAKYVYACEACHTESKKPGKCPKCGGEMDKMAMTYACEMCHTTAKKPGKCPKCGMAMKKFELKTMPK